MGCNHMQSTRSLSMTRGSALPVRPVLGGDLALHIWLQPSLRIVTAAMHMVTATTTHGHSRYYEWSQPLLHMVTACPRGRFRSRRASRPSPIWPKAVDSAKLEAASSSTRGSGRAPRGLTSTPGSAEPPRAARRALRRYMCRSRELARWAL